MLFFFFRVPNIIIRGSHFNQFCTSLLLWVCSLELWSQTLDSYTSSPHDRRFMLLNLGYAKQLLCFSAGYASSFTTTSCFPNIQPAAQCSYCWSATASFMAAVTFTGVTTGTNPTEGLTVLERDSLWDTGTVASGCTSNPKFGAAAELPCYHTAGTAWLVIFRSCVGRSLSYPRWQG